MQAARYLIQIIPKPHELSVDEAINVAVTCLRLRRGLLFFIEEHGAPEMNRPHAERGRASFDAFQFTCG